MKKIPIYLALLLALSACKKESFAPAPAINPADNLTLAEARAYVDDLPPVATADTSHHFNLRALPVPWDKAQSLKNSTGNYWLLPLGGQPLFDHFPLGYRKLALLRDSSNRIAARILEIIPDGLYLQRKGRVTTADFTGRIFVYDENYRLLSGMVYNGGKRIGKIRPAGRTLRTDATLDDCQWYEYNYIDAEGVVTAFAELDCSYAITSSIDLGNGDYAGGLTAAPPVSNLPGETGTGVRALDYTKCFSAMPVDNTTRMQVTVYVQEPLPGTSFNLGTNSVGHTAIGLTETTGGNSITQTLGFYPDASGKDKMHAPGRIVDNSGLDYQVSISYPVDAVQFANLINYLNSPLPAYDITSFNCTGYVAAACRYAGIPLPNAYTTVGLPYPDGTVSQAMTPAGLGNSIRNMQGQPGVNTNGGNVPRGNGPCN